MKFIAIYEQAGEGCDYSIGCGVKYEIFEAENRQVAAQKLYKKIVGGETYGSGDDAETCWPYNEDTELATLILAELPDYLPICIWNIEIYKKKEEQRDRFHRDDEIKELERLKAKYERK